MAGGKRPEVRPKRCILAGLSGGGANLTAAETASLRAKLPQLLRLKGMPSFADLCPLSCHNTDRCGSGSGASKVATISQATCAAGSTASASKAASSDPTPGIVLAGVTESLLATCSDLPSGPCSRRNNPFALSRSVRSASLALLNSAD